MEDNWTSKAIITPIVEYDYVRIDINNKIAEVNIIDYKQQNIVMKLFIDICKNEIKKTGTLENYNLDEDETIDSILDNIRYFIKEGISNP
ncbi:hypothetical protein CN378_05990 [Bacillus sp. AFS015802]|uniref:hypothetical protein n=1 Tax=Bacillus sp. AFS015802 TaxID=2033486 RepID=UPI000BF5119B|nr:hypothetical protein [Bacillus sp. AFS015802]PFA68756.1 hypothetical protein CN378_05990 [Bacillus sp. AFS015802]